jgi:hypothetical protein
MAGDESSRPELLAVCAEELAALVEHGLLDHVVRPSQDRRWDRQAEGLGGFEVDDELESCGLLAGRSAGFAPLRMCSCLVEDLS